MAVIAPVDTTQETQAHGPSPRLKLARRANEVRRRLLARGLVRFLVLAAGDIAAIAAGQALVVWVAGALLPAATAVRSFPPAVLDYFEVAAAVLVGLVVLETYGQGDRRRDATRLIAACFLGLALIYWQPLWSLRSILLLPGYLGVVGLLASVICLERFAIDVAIERFAAVSSGAARVLLVGTPGSFASVADHPALADGRAFTIVGQHDLGRASGRAGIRGLYRAIRKHSADTLVLVGSLSDEMFATAADAASVAGCQMYALTRSFSVAGVEPRVVWQRGAPLVQLNRPTLQWQQLAVKRTIDLLAAGVGLVVLAPLFAVVAVAVKLSSPGPVFFRQERVGLGGQLFRIVKFRSMVSDAEQLLDTLRGQSIYQDGRLFKVRNDPRVTRVGAFLRRTSLDELPQLWNVLVGDMSLVGPRPPLPTEVARYEEHHYARFDVKPGITGPWQASGRNSITDFEEVVRLETEYIRDWSLGKDLVILFRTIPVVLTGRGAH